MIDPVTYVCEMCRQDTPEKKYDIELGMCAKCLTTLQVDFKNAKEKPAKKYKLKFNDCY